jgi:hypothetical protein
MMMNKKQEKIRKQTNSKKIVKWEEKKEKNRNEYIICE